MADSVSTRQISKSANQNLPKLAVGFLAALPIYLIIFGPVITTLDCCGERLVGFTLHELVERSSCLLCTTSTRKIWVAIVLPDPIQRSNFNV
jgi:hypothetical protein